MKKKIYIYSIVKQKLDTKVGYIYKASFTGNGISVVKDLPKDGKYLCQVDNNPGVVRNRIVWFKEPNEKEAIRLLLDYEENELERITAKRQRIKKLVSYLEKQLKEK